MKGQKLKITCEKRVQSLKFIGSISNLVNKKKFNVELIVVAEVEENFKAWTEILNTNCYWIIWRNLIWSHSITGNRWFSFRKTTKYLLFKADFKPKNLLQFSVKMSRCLKIVPKWSKYVINFMEIFCVVDTISSTFHGENWFP